MLKRGYLVSIIILCVSVVFATINYDPSDRWELSDETKNPAYLGGIPVAYWSNNDPLRVYEGMIKQEDDPYHDWETDPSGPKVLSLDIIDPISGSYITTYILQTQSDDLLRFFQDGTREHSAWKHRGTKPVKILGTETVDTGFNGEQFKLLKVKDVTYSKMGQWYSGVLSRSIFQFGVIEFYKYNHDFNCSGLPSLVLRIDENDASKDILLASHEGWVYIVPMCGTGQPIAHHSTNSSIKIRGLMMPMNTTKGMSEALMIFDVKSN